MSTKNTEWKRIKLNGEQLDFTGARYAALESDGDSFISLTMKLKSGRTVRIRKNDYSVCLEEPVIPTVTKFQVKTDTGLEALFDSQESAEKALGELNGEIKEIEVPIQQPVKQVGYINEMPF